MIEGYETHIETAKSEVLYTKKAFEELKTENDIRFLWKAWADLVSHYSIALKAMKTATEGGSSQQWSNTVYKKQKENEMLQFAFQFRNFLSHFTATQKETSHGMVNLGGLVSLPKGMVGETKITIINSDSNVFGLDGKPVKIVEAVAEMKDGQLDPGSFPEELIQETNHCIKLFDFENNKVEYKVPNPQTPTDKQAIEIAEFVCSWLEKMLEECEELAREEQQKRRG
ncbi:hypothetical protein Q8W25_17590 [Shimia thalassica]|uniref:hypothetical protein n=1 Tax=Shimia thalassica TaxID=1715693 RepID=UPI0027349A89|nr:hypothetical protein [Shimia thalassica]MDP2495845.1 hypothetical protein [Shimia thalassica]